MNSGPEKVTDAPLSLAEREAQVGLRRNKLVRHGVLSGLPSRPKQATHMVSAVKLDLQSSSDVRKFSHQHIHNLTTYEPSTGLPSSGGLMDPHLGAEGDVMCKTCLNSARSGLCMGHNGHMDLQVDVLHPQFQRQIVKLLKCVCFACGTFLLKPAHRALIKDMPFNGKLKIAAARCSRRAFCPNPECLLPCQPTFKADTRLSIKATWDTKKACPKFNLKLKPSVFNRLMEEGGETAVEAERARQRLLKMQADAFWDADEKKEWAAKAKALDNETIRKVLHMALEDRGPLSMRGQLGLAPTLTADALIINALTVNSKITRPTRKQGRQMHDLSKRQRFVLAPTDNLIKLRQVKAALAAGSITPAEARKVIKDTSSQPISKAIKRLVDFSTEDVPTQVINLFDEKIVLRLQRTDRGGAKSTTSGVKSFLSGKNKLVRFATRGGRVELSGRAALGPSPVSWPVDVAGVPLWIATTLSRPESVTAWNKEKLQGCVKRGWHTRSGANTVVNQHGEAVKMKNLNEEQRCQLAQELDIGWTVHRCLQDGDYIIANRPPTLWCMNFMCFKVRIVDTFTLLLSHLLAQHFNFDFDGDALILHAVQSLMGLASMPLLSPMRYIINPTNGHPIMQPTLNTPMGAHLLSEGGMRLGREMVTRLLAEASPFITMAELHSRLRPPVDRTASGAPLWTGRQVLSTIIPPSCWFGKRSKLGERAAWSPDRLHEVNDVVVIEAGQILCGQWHGKRMFGGTFSLTQVMERDCGAEATCAFLSALMAMASAFLEARGFSFGTSDFLQTEEMTSMTQELGVRMHRAMTAVEHLPGSLRQKEANRTTIANQFLIQSTSLVHATRHKYDMLLEMTGCGAKGSDRHVAQMRVGLGQQLADGRRIMANADGTLPPSLCCFHRTDISAATRGLITHGFGSVDVGAFRDEDTGKVLGGGRLGLEPHEMYMLSDASKKAMACKSINVPKSGQLQAELAAGGQFANIRGNMRCRMVFSDRATDTRDNYRIASTGSRLAKSMHRVLDMSYGGNALDVQKTHAVRFDWLRRSNAELQGALDKDTSMLPATGDVHVASWTKLLVHHRTLLQRMGPVSSRTDFEGGLQTTYPLVLSMEREMLRLTHDADGSPLPQLPLDDPSAVERVRATAFALVENLINPLWRVAQGGRDIAMSNAGGTFTTFQMLPHLCDALWHLRPWRLIHLSVEELVKVCIAWLERIELALVDDGASVGMLAVYAIGAAATQAELDKFHHVGEEAEATINLLQRTRELASARATSAAAARTILTLAPGMSRERGDAWLQQHLFLRLDMVLVPPCNGGAQVLVLPNDTEVLTSAEAEAWQTTWGMYGFPAPSRRTVLLLRVDKFACERRKVTWSHVVRFVTKKLWMLADAGSLFDGSLPPSMLGPDAETPLVIATRETDEQWSMLVTCRDWSELEELRAALRIGGSMDDPQDFDAVEGGEEQLLVGNLALFMYRGLVMRGVQSMRGARLETKPHYRFDPATGSVVSTDRHSIAVTGCIKPHIVAKLDLQGIVDFSNCLWNDVHTVFETLGVEAARATWLREMKALAAGAVTITHLELLASIVFSQGQPHSIIVKPHVSRDGFLQTSTAGLTMPVFAEAALSGSKDALLGEAALFVGQVGTCGTHACDIVPDPEYLATVKGAELERLEALWSEEAEDHIVVPRTATEADDRGSDEEVIVVPKHGADEEDDGELVVVAPPRAAATRDDSDSDEELVVVAPPSRPAPPSKPMAGTNPLLPTGTEPNDFKQVGINTIHMPPTHSVPSGMLPPHTSSGDFAFTGDKQAAAEDGRIERQAHNAPSEMVRRMRGHSAALSTIDELAGGADSGTLDSTLVDNYRVFMGGYNLPDAVRKATQRGMTGIVNPASIAFPASAPRGGGSKYGARVGLRSMSGIHAQYGRSTEYRMTAKQRREFTKQSQRVVASMTADQQRAYYAEIKRRSNEKTAAAARRRRDIARAARVNSLAFQWRQRSPQRILPTNAAAVTPIGTVRIDGHAATAADVTAGVEVGASPQHASPAAPPAVVVKKKRMRKMVRLY